MTDQLPQKSLTTLIPANETERLAALHRYKILDTPPEAAFDRIAALAARLFQMPTALISLVDESRAWFKSRYGFDWQEMAHDATLCSFALLDDDVFIVPNAQQDDRFACNGFVLGEPGVRFYAGAPLLSHDGFNLGTLCVIDTQPRDPLSAEQQATLVDLAAMVVDELELRLATHKTAQSEEKYRTLFESKGEGFCICEMLFDGNGEPHDYRFLEVNSVFEQLTGLEQATGKTIRELVPNFEAAWIDIYGRVVQTGEPVRVENKSPAMNLWFDVNAFLIGEAQSHQFAVLFTNITERKRTEQALRESEERSVLAIRVAQLGTWRYVLATNLVELDARMREIWGEPEDAVVLPLSTKNSSALVFDLLLVITSCTAVSSTSNQSQQKLSPQVVKIDGSSTVFPITDAIAKDFQKMQGNNVKVTVAISGTGGGFKKFCAGKTDISNASRPILTAEFKACNSSSVRYIERTIAYDALTLVVHPENTWAKSLTTTELKKIWEPLAQGKITRWKQVRPD
ncbi:substrate-binding domain-containing protein [Chlorogloea sp. CCALA 695]|uniref:substrate-binding domain-containing protein n=1 Tax=Chlorogloea sp. CCALA 695 TaxID=2107693 RepID=UPI000D06D4F0|nr:substrate-binding domain-containing protein [Chlorogloea sp. CCALA 695]PSB27481.1 hypothetical protein C7B70_22525 [Chlorogloea sp. CCALA 695]